MLQVTRHISTALAICQNTAVLHTPVCAPYCPMKQNRETNEPETSNGLTPFTPVQVKARHDGWTPERQIEFIEALAACGCIEEACRAVGMSPTSAYKLRNRSDARAFRLAWRIALDTGVERLADAAFARALNGVSRPVFHGGEQIGEYRHFDERLTMFLLRYRDPVRFGKYMDSMIAKQHPEANAVLLARVVNLLEEELYTGKADYGAHGFGPVNDPVSDDAGEDGGNGEAAE